MDKEKDAYSYKNKLQAMKNKVSLLRNRKGVPGQNLSNEIVGKSSCDLTEDGSIIPKRAFEERSPVDSPQSVKSEDPDCTGNADNTMN